MSQMGSNINGKRNLAEFIEEIESLESEKAQTSEAIKGVYATATADGLDAKAIKQLIKERRADMDKTAELRVTVARYKKELGALGDTPLGEWASACIATERSITKRGTPKALQDKNAE
jgi:uncharacterized protein (UPF0335 family)